MPLIRHIFWHHKRRYGARRIAVELQAQGRPCGVDRVAKLLKTQGLQAIQPQSFRPQTTDSRHALGYSPNLLQRSPSPVQLNRVWVADITYIPLKETAFAYLALMLDLCSRRVVGWSLAEQMTETLVLDALTHAVRDRQPAPGLVYHSDRGGQYASQAYRAVLRRAEFRQSMSRAANCYDNAFMESCFGLHGILLRHRQDRTRNDRIPTQPSGKARHRQLPRLLQPRPPTFLPRLPRTSRFRSSPQPFKLSNSTVRKLPSSSSSSGRVCRWRLRLK